MKIDWDQIGTRTIQVIVVASLLWVGGAIRDLVGAVDNNSDSINQIYDWISDQKE